MAVETVRISLQVVLVLGLSLPKRPGRLDGGASFTGPETGRVHVGDRVTSDLGLFRRDREYRGAVAQCKVVDREA